MSCYFYEGLYDGYADVTALPYCEKNVPFTQLPRINDQAENLEDNWWRPGSTVGSWSKCTISEIGEMYGVNSPGLRLREKGSEGVPLSSSQLFWEKHKTNLADIHRLIKVS